jgi:hypothetical protein
MIKKNLMEALLKKQGWKIMHKWIKVDEDVPPTDMDVLLLEESGAIWLGQNYANGEMRSYPAQDLVPGKSITHWMPLPDPPEENK